MSPRTDAAWEAYFIPGTQVLANIPGITDKAELEEFENLASSHRMYQLLTRTSPRSFGFDTMCRIHGHIFGDVYEWAGTPRTGPVRGSMIKGYRDVVNHDPGDPDAPDRAYAYLPLSVLPTATDHVYGKLESSAWLTGLDRETFVDRLAEAWGEINTIHAFREGNTRSQIVFFVQLAANAGWRLDVPALQMGSPVRERFIAARFHNVATGDHSRLAEVLSGITGPAPGTLG